MEYSDLLDQAAKVTSSTEQMALICAFAVASYSSTSYRTKKPFNPLLGETYELDRTADLGWRCVCEQVRGCSCACICVDLYPHCMAM